MLLNEDIRKIVLPISDCYRGSLRGATVSSIFVTVFSLLAADMGETRQLSAIGRALFWGWAFVATSRRPRNPTTVDLNLIDCGCVPFVVAFETAIHLAWHWRGIG
jgi:hypothetical protein